MIASRFSIRYILDWLRGFDAEREQLLRMIRHRAELDREIKARTARTALSASIAAYIEYTDGRGPAIFRLEHTIPIDVLQSIARMASEHPDLIAEVLDDPGLIETAISLRTLHHDLTARP